MEEVREGKKSDIFAIDLWHSPGMRYEVACFATLCQMDYNNALRCDNVLYNNALADACQNRYDLLAGNISSRATSDLDLDELSAAIRTYSEQPWKFW